MKAKQFLQSKEPNTFIIPEEWLEEYANIVLSIAAGKVKTRIEELKQQRLLLDNPIETDNRLRIIIKELKNLIEYYEKPTK